jgi:hypothetical protein
LASTSDVDFTNHYVQLTLLCADPNCGEPIKVRVLRTATVKELQEAIQVLIERNVQVGTKKRKVEWLEPTILLSSITLKQLVYL